MLAFPNAKINIGLHILRKREDGYHDIESCIYPIPWHDVLEIIPSDSFSFQQTGIIIPGNDSDNLCIKAYQLLKKDLNLPSVSIHLHKVIPMGAGLGGGSSDAAFTIKLLNSIFELRLNSDSMKSYASKLGSDCPFFIDNIPAIASGRGTILEPVDIDLSDYYIGVIKPEIHISTREAYAHVTPKERDSMLSDLIDKPIEKWGKEVKNDFESSVFPKYPALLQIKQKIIDQGALYASMSGSGSSVFGLFGSEQVDMEFDLFKKLRINI